MTDNEIKREKTFEEELPYFKERLKEVFDNYHNPNGNEDPLYICVLCDSKRIVRKAEEEINCLQEEIELWKNEYYRACAERDIRMVTTKFIRKEAIKEFAERLKEKFVNIPIIGLVASRKIDNLVKEMAGDK